MASEIVTVLFTDLVGSTELLSRVGEERADGLRREAFDLSRRAIGANGGREVKNVGDGLMVVFGAPSAALNAAVVIQQALDTRNREMTEPLALRIGVSTGECNTEDGDFFGGAVIEAARLCGRADGGQIFVSGLVRTLAGTRGGHELAALGELELKGFDEPVDAYELRWQPAPVESLAVPLPARLVRAADTLFVGRAPECAALLQGLKEGAAAGRRRISFVSGEAGIGKTTLLCEFAHRAHEQGAVVLYGRCEEDLAVPYQPWREALAHVAQHAPELLQDDSGLLGSILGWAETERSSGDPASERYLLYATLVELLVRVSGRAPLVIVLEDLHWADGPSIALLRHLASSNAPLRLLLVGTLRDAELGPNDPLTDALAALHREDGVARLPLRGLGDVEVLALLERLAGHEMDANGVALRDALLSETDGNPFFMTEILRHLSETGAIYPDDSGRWLAGPNLREHGFPVSVREVIARRVARLGDNTRRALGYASVIGRDFDLEVLADVMDSDSDALLDLLEPAVQHTIVLDVAPGRFSFAHALIEHALYDELTPTRRARAHGLVGAALEARLDEDAGARAGELARHLVLATSPNDTGKAVSYTVQAGDFALAQLAPDEAQRWYESALELLDQRPGNSEGARARVAALVGLGDARRQLSDARYRETLADAGRLARREDTDLLVRAALATNRGSSASPGTVATEIVELIGAALHALGDEQSPRRAKLLACLANELVFGDPDRAREFAREAVRVARASGDDAALVWTASRAEFALRGPDTVHEGADLSREVMPLADRIGDPVLRWDCATAFVSAHLELGDIEEAGRLVAICDELATKIGQPYMRWVAGFKRSVQAFVAGRLDDSEAFAAAALQAGMEGGHAEAASFYGAQLAMIREAQGRSAEIVDLVAQVVDDNPGIPAARGLLARLYAGLDRHADAARILAPDLADGFSSYPFDLTWTSSMRVCAETVSELRLQDAAQLLSTRLTPYADVLPCGDVAVFEVLHVTLGRLATVLERYDEAETHFRRAHEIHERMDAPPFLARTQIAWAEMLTRRDLRNDRSRARDLARTALDVAHRLHFGEVERRASRLLDLVT